MPQSDRDYERLQVLDALGEAVRGASDPLIMMRRIVKQSIALIPAADGAAVEQASAGQLTYVCAGGHLAEHVGTRFPIEHSLSGLALTSGETLHCQDCATDSRVDREVSLRVGSVSMVCVPLYRGEQAIGVLKVSARRPHAFTDNDVSILTTLADFISVAIGAVSDISRTAGELIGVGHDPVAEFVANVVQPGIVTDLAVRRRIRRVVAHASLSMLVQPIVALDDGKLFGVEALARFPGEPHQPPDTWFHEAAAIGLGVQLQMIAVNLAIELLERLPGEAFLAINLGPDAITAGHLPTILEATRPDRIIIELTEHISVDDYPRLAAALDEIRTLGARLAIDDIGAGFASLGHVVNLAPHVIKLDREFTHGIDHDPVRRAVAQALVSLAHDTDALVVAEGIETHDELNTVRRLGIRYGQGYLIGRPADVGTIREVYAHAAPAIAAERR